MPTISSLVTKFPIRKGSPDRLAVEALQTALVNAGYRVGVDGDFGPRTDMVVRQFQQQHGLTVDGQVGPVTAAELDKPPAVLIAKAAPLVHASGFPHDDTASLIAFYGDPDAPDFDSNMVGVTPEALLAAHQADQAIEMEEGVTFKQAWADPVSGHVFCLAEGPSAVPWFSCDCAGGMTA